MGRRALLLIGLPCWLGLAAGCSKDTPANDRGLPDATSDASDAGPDRGADLGPSAVGEPCTTTATPQGSCPAGYVCSAPQQGGFCTRPCGFASCPHDALCVISPVAGEFCAKPCTADTSCRQGDGWRCDPVWQVCTLPGLLAPKLASCPGSAPPRKVFGPSRQLSSSAGPGRYQTEPAAALGTGGRLLTLFMAPGEQLEDVALSSSLLAADGALQGDRPFTTVRKNAFDVWLASDRQGTHYAVYYGHDGFDTNGAIVLHRTTDGLDFGTAREVHDPGDCAAQATGCLDKPMIAVGPRRGELAKDNIYVAYYGAGNMRLRRSEDGGQTFAPSVRVGPGAYGDIEVAGDGSLHVTYVGVGGGGPGDRLGSTDNRVEYVRSDDNGATFSKPVTASAAGASIPFYFSNPQLAPLPQHGTIHLVYPHGTPQGVWSLELATSTDGGQTWGQRVKVNDDDACANHMTPTVVAEQQTGRLHLAWLENRASGGRVAYASCAPGGASCSANETLSDRPFAAYELVRHSPRWLGEYFSLLLDEPLKVLHAVWTQPVDEQGSAVGRIFTARGQL